MNAVARRFLRRLVPAPVVHVARRVLEKLDPFVQLSYSQEGEDMFLRRMFDGQKTGFYVDVGAHHPFRFSNTAYFYARGWSGINLEPDPDGADALMRYRRRDCTVNCGIGAEAG